MGLTDFTGQIFSLYFAVVKAQKLLPNLCNVSSHGSNQIRRNKKYGSQIERAKENSV